MLFFGCWHGQTRDGKSRRIIVIDFKKHKFHILKKQDSVIERDLSKIQCVRKHVKYDLGLTIYFEDYNSPVHINLDSIQDRDDLAHLLQISSRGKFVEFLREQFGVKYELSVDCKKKGSFGWLSRFFVLQNYHICIFHNRDKPSPASCLSLLGCEAQLSENTITIYFPSRGYIFAFSDEEIAKMVFLKISKVKKQELIEPRLALRTLPPEIKDVLLHTEGFRPTKYGLLNDLVVRTVESGSMRLVKGTIIKIVNIEQHSKHLTITLVEPVKGKSRIDKMKNFLGIVQYPGGKSSRQKRTPLALPDDLKLKWSVPPLSFRRSVLASLDQSNIMYWGMNHCVTERNIQKIYDDPERLENLNHNKYCTVVAPKDGSFLFGITLNQKVYVVGKTNEPEDRSPLGIGEVTSTPDPQLVRDLKDIKIVQIASSRVHTIAVSSEKVVYGWGHKDLIGLAEHTNRPKVITFLEELQVIGVAACVNHSAVWTKNGGCYTFGLFGPWLGLGATTPENDDVSIPFGKVQFNEMEHVPILKVVCSSTHTMALFKNGVVALFGMNQYGQIGVGEKYSVCDIPVYVNLTGCVDIACGRFHSLVVVRDEQALRRGDKTTQTKVYGFGTLQDSRLGMNNLPKSLTKNGNVYLPTVIPHLSQGRVVRVIAGNKRSFAITEEGCLLQWGSNPAEDRVVRNPTVLESMRPYQIFDVTCGLDFAVVLGNKLPSGLVESPSGLRPKSRRLPHRVQTDRRYNAGYKIDYGGERMPSEDDDLDLPRMTMSMSGPNPRRALTSRGRRRGSFTASRSRDDRGNLVFGGADGEWMREYRARQNPEPGRTWRKGSLQISSLTAGRIQPQRRSSFQGTLRTSQVQFSDPTPGRRIPSRSPSMERAKMRANTYGTYADFMKGGYAREPYGKRTANQFAPQRMKKRTPNQGIPLYATARHAEENGSTKKRANSIGLEKPPRPIPSSFPQKNAGDPAFLDKQPPSGTPPTALGNIPSSLSKKQQGRFRKSETKLAHNELYDSEIVDDDVPPVPSGPVPQSGMNGGGYYDSDEERRRLESMNLEHANMRDQYRDEGFPSGPNSASSLSTLGTSVETQTSSYTEKKEDKVDSDGCQLPLCVIS